MSHPTKKLLGTELKTLMKSKSIEQITVTELVDACQITRQTFYYHFQDIYALLEWVYEDDFIHHIKNEVDYTNWKDSFLVILNYVSNNYDFCLNTLNSLQRNQFTRMFYHTISELLSKVFYDISGSKDIPQQDADFIVNFFSHAFSGIVVDWILSGCKEPSSEIIGRLSWIMDQQYVNAIEHAKHFQSKQH
ncbi:hypothetical protein AOC36_05270 [Erysipelothrix larvae]|uniref:HTH tetR-type domain-containing protein n=1 Tax=Erysipelothrix larvae TaxID=1514105 RepID=A0A0X8GZV3_9FIRM|nr:TetR/AcrR family transcriptional regulator C-terminal domain-containing protein [Erysipelothrix larvae]AMC93409.1 hypothetical protein AOC36_05270 [Erysipelothrix larvae]